MLNVYNILETIRMIQDECLDIRTITMGISLLDCIDTDIDRACEKVYNKIVSKAGNLVPVGQQTAYLSLTSVSPLLLSPYLLQPALTVIQ